MYPEPIARDMRYRGEITGRGEYNQEPISQDMTMFISKDGNSFKADLDDITNPKVLDVGIQKTPVAGELGGQQTATSNPLSDLIGEIIGGINDIINSIIGGIR